MDKDDSGLVEINELKEFVKKNPDVLPKCFAKTLLKLHDTNKDGKLNFEEFLEMTEVQRWQLYDFAKSYCNFIVPKGFHKINLSLF
jgi:hypothetical protein